MSNIATDMEAPISEEFGRVFKETQRGMTLEESMNRMVERTDSDDLDMLCTAIIIQRKVGGNLAEVLEKISGTIQSRISLRKEIKNSQWANVRFYSRCFTVSITRHDGCN